MGKILNPELDSEKAKILRDALKETIVNQDEAIDALVDVVEKYHAGISSPNQPLGSLMFLGGTGCGKTRAFEVLCGVLFGNEKACVKIDCGEFQHSGDIAKLVGSPPGYLGHKETPARLSQSALNANFNDDYKLSVVLFDEIEKASDALWHIMLGILDKATLTLGSNETVDFSKCIIGMTSNAGSDVIAQSFGNYMGFSKNVGKATNDIEVGKVAIEEAKRKFTTEFINRIDRIVSFNPLTKEDCNKIIDIELNRLQMDIFKQVKFFSFSLSSKAKNNILEEGFDPKYNARSIRRIIDKKLSIPLARLVASEQINEGDIVNIGLSKGKFVFESEPGTQLNLDNVIEKTEEVIEEKLDEIEIPWLEEKLKREKKKPAE